MRLLIEVWRKFRFLYSAEVASVKIIARSGFDVTPYTYVGITNLPRTKHPPFGRRHTQINFHEYKVLYFDTNFTEVFLKGQIDNKSVEVQAMAWRRTGGKPLSEPMLIQITDAYMWY